MNHSEVIRQLEINRDVFAAMLGHVAAEDRLIRQAAEKWCLLEIVCHLRDEEIYDFRARTMHVLNGISSSLPAIDPEGWVKSRNYTAQNYDETLGEFLKERHASVEWLSSLKDPDWKREYIHERFGAMSAEFFLANWLAHDYLHFRQISALKYFILKSKTNLSLQYAGSW